jgi:hypothetical protein
LAQARLSVRSSVSSTSYRAGFVQDGSNRCRELFRG